MRPRGGGLGGLGEQVYKAGSHIGTSKYFSFGLLKTVGLSSVELRSVDSCSSSSTSRFRICTPSKDEANGRFKVLSAYTIIHDVILIDESVQARCPRQL